MRLGHHFRERQADPAVKPNPYTQARHEFNAKLFDDANGTFHQLHYFGCKHCSAWAEIDAFDTVKKGGV